MELKRLLQKGPLLFDGSMGTYFASRCKDPFYQCELATLTMPELIGEIHREYLQAGCKAIKTNTFAAAALAKEAGMPSMEELICAAWTLAKKEAEPFGAAVFADIGPLPACEGDLQEEYLAEAEEFLRLGADCFLFETFGSFRYLKETARYIKEKQPQACVIVSFAVGPDGFTAEGQKGTALYALAEACPHVDAVGFNCVSGPHHLHEYMMTLPHGEKPLSIMPNAGYPTVIGRRAQFGRDAEYFAEQMAAIAADGAMIVGGCCGTTPQFIAKTAQALQGVVPNREKPAVSVEKPAVSVEKPAVKVGHNPIAEAIKEKKRLIAVELDPPLTADTERFMAGAARLKAAGVDLLTIADCPVARARMDSSLLACKVMHELDLQPLPHMTCRDRNINATRALLLGLCAEDVHNVLVVTGDPIPSAQRDEVKSVFQFNSRMMAGYISALNETEFDTPFTLYGALNINAVNFEVQLGLAKEKMKNGVTAFLTQPVLSREALENLKRAKQELSAYLFGGIIPVVSHRNACFMNHEISGIRVCDEIIDLYEGKTKEESAQLAVRISCEIARKMAPYTDGFYLITPFQRTELMEEIIQEVKKL